MPSQRSFTVPTNEKITLAKFHVVLVLLLLCIFLRIVFKKPSQKCHITICVYTTTEGGGERT